MKNHLAIGGFIWGMAVSSMIAIGRWRPGRITAIAIALALFLGVSPAGADATTQPDSVSQDNSELRGEVDQLKAKVDQLESVQQQLPPAPPKIPDTNQAAFHAFHFTSGYDPAVGFVIRSDDGQFSLHPGIVMDFRNMTNYREEVPPNSGSEEPKPGDSTQNGFDMSRFRITFDGRVTQNFSYFVQLQDDQGTSFGLLDAYWAYRFGKDSPFALKVGQFKDPVWHERNLSEADLLAVDRSLVEYLLCGGQTARVQGIDLMFDKDRVRTQLVFHDGFNSGNTKFFDAGGLARAWEAAPG